MFELLRQRPQNGLRALDHLRKDLDSFDDIFEALSHFHGFSPLKGISAPDFSPSLELVEKKDKYIAAIEIPGMTKDNVDISIDEDSNTLIIKGEKKQEKKDEGDDCYVCERVYGSFRREIALPKNITHENISAEYKDGVLRLTLPKEEKKEAEKKKLSIKVT